MHSGTYKPYKDGRHMLIEFNRQVMIYYGNGMDYDDGELYDQRPRDLYFDRQELGMKMTMSDGVTLSKVLLHCEVIEEGNFENITQQFINKQKKHFVIDPQKEIENNKKKNKL